MSRVKSVRDAMVAEVVFASQQVTDVLVVDPIVEANNETMPPLADLLASDDETIASVAGAHERTPRASRNANLP